MVTGVVRLYTRSTASAEPLPHALRKLKPATGELRGRTMGCIFVEFHEEGEVEIAAAACVDQGTATHSSLAHEAEPSPTFIPGHGIEGSR